MPTPFTLPSLTVSDLKDTRSFWYHDLSTWPRAAADQNPLALIDGSSFQYSGFTTLQEAEKAYVAQFENPLTQGFVIWLNQRSWNGRVKHALSLTSMEAFKETLEGRLVGGPVDAFDGYTDPEVLIQDLPRMDWSPCWVSDLTKGPPWSAWKTSNLRGQVGYASLDKIPAHRKVYLNMKAETQGPDGQAAYEVVMYSQARAHSVWSVLVLGPDHPSTTEETAWSLRVGFNYQSHRTLCPDWMGEALTPRQAMDLGFTTVKLFKAYGI
jgi:hypothetical protein